MPATAFALVGLFAIVSVVAGVVAWRALGPGGVRAAVLPSVAAFGALYLAGHRLGLAVGPTVPLFGFEVALFGDVAIALVTAFAVAWAQRQALLTLRRAR
jgi:hypothetical protein